METEPQREPLRSEIPRLAGDLRPVSYAWKHCAPTSKGNMAFVHDLLIYKDVVRDAHRT